MSEYTRSVSASDHELEPETIWQLQLPDIYFGRGVKDRLGEILEGLGAQAGSCGLVIADSTLKELGQLSAVGNVLTDAGLEIDCYTAVEREPAVASVTDCVEFARDTQPEGYDFFIGLGGGSPMDTAKAVRMTLANGGKPTDYIPAPFGDDAQITNRGAPLVLVPTTAGTGSEVSQVTILSDNTEPVKNGITSPKIQADAALLDPVLTMSLPPDLTAATGMDALGSALEGLTTHRYDQLLRANTQSSRPTHAGRTPITEIFSETAIKLLVGNIRQAVNNGEDLEARTAMLRGSLFGSIGGLTAGATLCHAMSYPVSTAYNTYHGETVAVLTPASTLGFNAASDPQKFERIAKLLGVNTTGRSPREAADTVQDSFVSLQQDLNVVPSGLAELADITESELDDLAARTIDTQSRLLRANPRPVTKDDVRDVYRNALYNWHPD